MPEDFSTTIKLFAAKAVQSSLAVVQISAYECFKYVVEYSPVRSGRFRDNWRLSVGRLNPFVDGTDREDNPTHVWRDPITPAEDVVARYTLIVLTPDQNVFISNSIWYAEFLEAGGSGMAPTGVAGPAAEYIEGLIPSIVARVAAGERFVV